MAKYTIEDIEILRKKSGISYEEAVNLLEYHNGSLAQALVDLEKNGRLKNDASAAASHKGIKGVLQYLYSLRMIVKKDEITIVNLSMLFVLILLFTAPHICVIGVVLALVLGYRIRFVSRSLDFVDDDLEEMVKNAKKNVQESVSSFTQQFVKSEAKQEEPAASQPRTETAPSGTRPVNVQFPDGGSVDVRDSGDGYHEADIH